MKATDLVIRQAGVDDISELLRQRIGMYEAMDVGDQQSRQEMAAASERILPQAIRNGNFRAWLAEVDGRVVAGGGLFITDWLSHPGDYLCRRATVLNVYTEPEFRRQGIARKLMQVILDWCRDQGFATVFLHASREGRPLYEKFGFEAGNEMRLKLKP